MPKRLLIFLVNLLLLPFFVYGQPLVSSYEEAGDPFIQHFTARDYDASIQNWDILQDARGIMYFANTSGILEYDGVNWRRISTPLGSVIRSLAMDDRGIIYVAGQREPGYLAPDSLGLSTFVLVMKKLRKPAS